ncbi:hypothetical protein FRC06_008155 [Ceratobasidium sp. 370]|nr:hypothetical protein FRC06_008155 [Ceratobasidium sp. 370]
MSYHHTSPHTPSLTEINLSGIRQSAKRPRERSISPHFDDAREGGTQPELEPEETLLSLSDLIRPLSTTPSPEPTLHFGTPPSIAKLGEITPATLSHDDSSRMCVPTDCTEEDLEDIIDDSRVAEMRKTVIDWGLGTSSNASERSGGSREQRLAMMVMALTHPARPTASQIAAQAEHIRALLTERNVMVQQLEDLSEFRHADRLGFERTAQALNARVTKGAKPNDNLMTAIYQDERTQNAELQARNERLHAENVRLERELKDAKREIVELRQSIEGLRVNLLISPRTPSSTDAQAAFHSAMVSPTPNPRGRPRKYPLPSPTHTPLFQPPTHSNPAAQLPISSMSVLNPGISLATSGQPPPEKRMRPTQPDARAELLLAAARRVGKDRVVEVLEGPESTKKGNLELGVETDIPQPLVYPRPHPSRASQREPPSITRPDHPIRRGRPPKASASFPSTARHHFNQFLVEETGQPDTGYVYGMNAGPIRNPHEANSANPQRCPSRHQQPQQVVVAFTGDPQADAQACLASFVAQYPGIQPVPTWGTGKGDARPESGITGELQTTEMARSAATRTTGTVQRTHSTPELVKSGGRNSGLEHLLTAARTVLRARSRSTTPTPRRHPSSASALSSPYRSPRPKSGGDSHQAGPTRRRHSSPAVSLGDSDTEPEGSPTGRRVYSALDVLADQAAAVRTSSPDPPADARTSSPEPPGHPASRSMPVLGSPALLSAFRSAASAGLPTSSPGFSLPPSDQGSSPASLDVVDAQLRAPSKSPLGASSLGISETVVDAGVETTGGQGLRMEEFAGETTSESMGSNARQPDTTTDQTQSPKSPLHTPPRSEKARGKQRA